MIEDVMQGLDDEQRAVVEHENGPALVIAGPGSGKTRTLVARAARLLAQGVAPEAIMMITFTRSAAASMIRRASAIDPRAAYITAGTFHSVGSRIVQANHRLLGAEKEFTVLDGDDVEQLVKRHLDAVRGAEKGWPRASTVAKIISYAVNTGMGIGDAVRLKAPKYAEMADGIAEIAVRYAEHKIDHGFMAYDDILTMWTALLEDEEIGDQLRSRWKHVMLDEQQDGNRLLHDLTVSLTGPDGNVLAVGDTAQAIYSFRGSSPNTMRDLHEHHPEAKIYTISSNYRSTVPIVALAAAIDARLDTGFKRRLRAATPRQGPRPAIVDVRDAAAEAELVAETIQRDRDDGGEYEHHAVLVRSMTNARRIEAEFITRRIPFRVQGGTRIDEAAHIRDLLSVARLAGNLSHEPAWTRLLTRFPRIGDGAAAVIAGHLMGLGSVEDAALMLEKEGAARRTGLATLADALRAAATDDAPADRLEAVIREMDPVWSQVWPDDWKARSRDLEAVTLIAQEHARMEDFLTAIAVDASIDREVSSGAEKQDEAPVTISTVHGAKGLEWRKVHLPGFVNGGMPSMFSATDEEREEEKRILFVAATRAQDELTFYRPRFNGAGNLTSMSEYEPYIAAHVDQRQHAGGAPTGNVAIQSDRKVDVRSRMMRTVKR